MVNIRIIAVGKLKEKYFTEAYDEYVKRLSGLGVKLTAEETEPAYLPEEPSESEIAKALDAEAEKILKKIPADSFVVPMCIEGKQLSSEQLAARLSEATDGASGNTSVTFIIGGSCGLSDKIKSRGDLRLSMSAMTFPHRLARVMLAEQIYRAFTIIRNRKYHK